MNTCAKQRPLSEGNLIDVGGFRLHYSTAGDGDPTVVLLSGAGAIAALWEIIQRRIACFTTVCSYDRAGVGQSERGPKPSSIPDHADQLHRLVHNARIRTPIILVGMSYGGLIVKAFHHRYPKSVCGVVMVDAAETSFVLLPEFRAHLRKVRREFAGHVLKARLGLLRLWMLRHPEEANLPEQFSELAKRQFRASLVSSSNWRASLEEVDSYQRSEAALRDLDGFDSLPLVVVRHGKDLGFTLPGMTQAQTEEAWLASQENLARLSSDSLLVVARNSGHNIMFDEPELVVETVQLVVEAVRKHTPVTNLALCGGSH